VSPDRRSRTVPDLQRIGEAAPEGESFVDRWGWHSDHRGNAKVPVPLFTAFRSMFFRKSADREAYLSFLSQSAFFFFRKALRSRKRNEAIQESLKTTDRGWLPSGAGRLKGEVISQGLHRRF